MFNNVIAYFTSEQFLKEKTALNDQFDIRRIVPFLGNAQEMWIQPILGTALYTRLQEGILANNLTTDEVNLLTVIRPVHSYYTVFAALPFIAVELRNAGLVQTANPNVTQASSVYFKELLNQTKNTAEFYGQRLIQYLCDNRALFPLYTSTTGLPASRATTFNGGFYYDNPGCGNTCSCSESTRCNCK